MFGSFALWSRHDVLGAGNSALLVLSSLAAQLEVFINPSSLTPP